MTSLEAALPEYLLRQRWYPAKGAGAPAVALSKLIPFGANPESALAIWTATPPAGQPFRLFIPVAVFDRQDAAISGPASIAGLANGRVIGDALVSDDFVREFVAALLQRTETPGVAAGRTEQAREMAEESTATWSIHRSQVEQSNTSIRIGDGAMLKVIRKLAEGIHPELEMGRYLTPRLEPNAIPALFGWMDLEGCTVALLQAFVANKGDGWTWMLQRLRSGKSAQVTATLPWIRTLGKRTAQMHVALAQPTDDSGFAPEAVTPVDWSRWIAEISAMARQVSDALPRDRAMAATLGTDATKALAQRCAGISALLEALIPFQPVVKTRHHGDFHLGQVLAHDDDVTIVDFEGEPLRPLQERRAKHVALRDVAGMLRSFAYAAAVAEKESSAASGNGATAASHDAWLESASAAYVDAYLHALPQRRAAEITAAKRILRLFTIEKALYEVLYELANRPAWAVIPVRSLMTLLEIRGASDRPTP